jgi:threonine dehydrogenase-like Zn-dependent dehydrogenase
MVLVDVQPLIQRRYPLSEGLAAFEQVQQRGAMKILLEP